MIRFIKKRGYTDRLYFLNLTLTWIFMFLCFILIALSGILGIQDVSVLGVMAAAAFTELSIHTTWVVRKAEKENASKHKNDMDIMNIT